MVQRAWCKILLIYILNIVNCNSDGPSGENFLHSMMDKIQSERFKSSLGLIANHLLADKSDATNSDIQPEIKNLLFRIMAPDYEQYPPYDPEDQTVPQVHENVDDHPNNQNLNSQNQSPTLPLSRDELLALYQAALNKGANLNITSLPELTYDNGNEIVSPANQGELPGYYYYFYPIKSFMNSNGDQQQQMGDVANMMMQMQGQGMGMPGAPVKRFEPLFIAMASFVGVAMMFILSILFMPKFGNVRSDVAAVKEATEESDLSDLSKIVFEAIEGRDCSERLACELGQAIRVMKLGSKPIRAIEIFLPPNLARQLALVRKSVSKRERCSFIPCKDKSEIKKPIKTLISVKKPFDAIKNNPALQPHGPNLIVPNAG